MQLKSTVASETSINYSFKMTFWGSAGILFLIKLYATTARLTCYQLLLLLLLLLLLRLRCLLVTDPKRAIVQPAAAEAKDTEREVAVYKLKLRLYLSLSRSQSLSTGKFACKKRCVLL